MKKLTLKELQMEELKILIEVDKFCKERDLRYSLCGGTLLGAIRHKGFIPWDDDIDICMPRKDYKKLIESFDGFHKDLRVHSNLLNNLDAPFTKIVNEKTLCVNDYTSSERNSKIWIDIFPVDGLPSDMKKMKKLYRCRIFWGNVLGVIDSKIGKGKTFFRRYSKIFLKPIAKIYGKKRCINKIEKLAKKYPYLESKYVGVITWGQGIQERMLKEDFEQYTRIYFEGNEFCIFKCWHEYLSNLYGNYMVLPPLEERRTHEIEAYRLN